VATTRLPVGALAVRSWSLNREPPRAIISAMDPRRLPSLLCALGALGALLAACAHGAMGPLTEEPPDVAAVEACERALAGDDVELSLSTCAASLPPGCREAWAGSDPATTDPRPALKACQEAVCPRLARPRPFLCGVGVDALTDQGVHDAWRQVHARIIAPAVGEPRAQRAAARFASRFLAPSAVEEKVAARVNGVSIAVSRVEAEVARASLMGDPPPRLLDVLARIIDRELFRQLLEREEITVTEEEAEAEQAAFLRAAPPGFLRWVQATGSGVVEVRAMVVEKLGLEKLFESRGRLVVTPAEVTAFYQDNPGRFERPEARRAWEIFVAAPRGSGSSERRRGLEKILAAHRELVEGRDFSEVAVRYSEGRNAEAGGDLDFIPRGAFPAEVEDVAFTLGEGEHSAPIVSELGFHLVKVGPRRPPRTVPLDEAADWIREYLRARTFRQERRDELAELRASADIEILIEVDGR